MIINLKIIQSHVIEWRREIFEFNFIFRLQIVSYKIRDSSSIQKGVRVIVKDNDKFKFPQL